MSGKSKGFNSVGALSIYKNDGETRVTIDPSPSGAKAGVASGAIVGAVLGPGGAIVGAVIGGTLGAIFGKNN